MKFRDTITYDDVLLTPKYSDIKSRSEISLRSYLDDRNNFMLPIISSPMDTVTEDVMANAIGSEGGLGIIHRYNNIEKQVELFGKTNFTTGCAIGVSGDYLERAAELYKNGCRVFCVDIAHGHHILMKNTLCLLKETFSDIHIMAGNVATAQGFYDLSNWGADSIRVGIGNGCFVPNTLVKTESGLKKIQNILIGDKVYTHDGTLKTVIDTMNYERNEEIMIINGIECTKNHEFYVIEKSNVSLINEQNIHNYAMWIEASELDLDKHLLIEI